MLASPWSISITPSVNLTLLLIWLVQWSQSKPFPSSNTEWVRIVPGTSYNFCSTSYPSSSLRSEWQSWRERGNNFIRGSLAESGKGQFLQGGKRKTSIFWSRNRNSVHAAEAEFRQISRWKSETNTQSGSGNRFCVASFKEKPFHPISLLHGRTFSDGSRKIREPRDPNDILNIV